MIPTLMSISDLVSHLANPDQTQSPETPVIHLPTFQRGEVWKNRQVCELWDSLLRGIPLPSILIAPVGKGDTESAVSSPKIKEILSKSGDARPNDFWLLDGQQRVVALQVGLGLRESEASYAHRLWLDLAWTEAEARTHGRRFGFFACTTARPWGDAKKLDGRPEGVREARRHLHKQTPLDGRFDCELSLRDTWPVAARQPIPASSLLSWALERAESSELDEAAVHRQLAALLEIVKYLPLDKQGDIQPDAPVVRVLTRALQRLHKVKVAVVCAELDPEEGIDALMATFTRLNRNGTPLADNELFYSALKHAMPKSYELVQEAAKKAPLLGELDILQGLTVLASQQPKVADAKGELKRAVAPTGLTPDFLKTLRRHGPSFDESIQQYLGRPELVEQALGLLRWKEEPPKDPGLPLTMIPRLKLHTWLPVVRWVEKRPAGAPVVSREERHALLRYALVAHFFADWHDQPDAALRDFLDQVEVSAKRGGPIPLPPEPSKWLKSIQISDANSALQTHSLPLSPIDVDRRFLLETQRSSSPAADDGLLWLGGRNDDLLMWAQRAALEDWFGVLEERIQHLGEIGRPWDWDHITPGNFFKYSYAQDPSQVPIALRALWPSANELENRRAWDIFWSLHNRTGNYRIWPMGFNRRDGDIPPIEKLKVPEHIDNEYAHVVLANWLQGNVGRADALREASAIDASQPWNETPDKKQAWSLNEMEAFIKSIQQREKAIYAELWAFIEPALPTDLQGDRIRPQP